MYVAAKLGFDWTLVVSNLGLKQAEIEQIQMDNPYKVINMISIALQRWRDRQDGQSDEVPLQQLFSALKNCNRMDLVDELQQKYNIPEDNPKED
ncbi:ankyrin-3-like [Saccostrea echinata]|uniref:ankyrin-3-like n=1 Tax=Saccostrea echinata TaxID=191078 RepID=UPI002A810733|nr:ankyrin-3-like [Saccostrea echinata]